MYALPCSATHAGGSFARRCGGAQRLDAHLGLNHARKPAAAAQLSLPTRALTSQFLLTCGDSVVQAAVLACERLDHRKEPLAVPLPPPSPLL
eukprot:365277-Chlamydomonas_euryale.AAC.7